MVGCDAINTIYFTEGGNMTNLKDLMAEFEKNFPYENGRTGGAISVTISRYAHSGALKISGFLHYPDENCDHFKGLAELKKLIRG